MSGLQQVLVIGRQVTAKRQVLAGYYGKSSCTSSGEDVHQFQVRVQDQNPKLVTVIIIRVIILYYVVLSSI